MTGLKNSLFLFLIFVLCTFCTKKTEQGPALHFSKTTDSLITIEALKNKRIDSLSKMMSAAGSDTLKIKRLLPVSRLLDYKTAEPVYNELMSLAGKHGLPDIYYEAALLKEYRFANMGMADSVKHYYELIYTWAFKHNKNGTLIGSLLNYSNYFERVRRHDVSDSILLKAVELMREFKLHDSTKYALAFYYLGKNKNYEFDIAGALNYLNQAAKYSASSQNDGLTGDIYFRIGECYLTESDFNNALKAYGNSLLYCRRVNDESTMSSVLSAIGEIYMHKEDLKKAYENLFASLELAKKTNYRYQEAYTCSSLGSVFELDSNYKEALHYLNESNRIYESFNKDGHGSEILLNNMNIGTIYNEMGEYDKGLEYLNKVYETVDKETDPAIAAEVLSLLGEIYLKKGDLVKAEEWVKKALAIAREIDQVGIVQSSYDLLSQIAEKKKDFKGAFMYHKSFVHLADSTTNKSQIKKFAELENEVKQNQLKAEHDKAEAVLRNEKLQKEIELNRQRIMSTIIGAGFILLLLGAILIYRSLRENKKKTKIISEQKKEVEKQKEIIEEQKKEVLDSIAYAKRIQEAILPSDESIQKAFTDAFIFYKPKDIVAGDFYWMEEEQGYILIAVADCTGHGVPGAMVSVVCSNALNKAVKEFALRDPGAILSKVREFVIDTFKKSGSEVQDGMDISLLAIDRRVESDGVKIKWAGANNPLWFIKNQEIVEIKGDKQPVGKFINEKPFTTSERILERESQLYLISDGFADQFGGPKGKKFKYRQLQALLLSVSDMSCSEQKQILNQQFNQWKQNLEQVDDVTVLGIKV